MIILGIETSCDETAAAVVQDGTNILSNVVASSVGMHVKTGGIIPENAARQQIKSIIPVINNALVDSLQSTVDRSLKVIDLIDAVAVTIGPGLIGSLLVGVETAKTLSYLWKKPIIPVNHLIAHIYANFLTTDSLIKQSSVNSNQLPKFPILALVVSGGHTDLVRMKEHGKIEWLGGTRDDAAGEAFDKCARLLGLPYPGGPAISREAEKHLSHLQVISYKSLKLFPRPLSGNNSFDFSFSGLKTSVYNYLKSQKSKVDRLKLSAEIQEAIIDSLVIKSTSAIKKFKPKSFVLAGGVASNIRLREKLDRVVGNMKFCEFHVAPTPLCTDNAAPVASCAFFNYHPIDWKEISANPQLTIAEGNL